MAAGKVENESLALQLGKLRMWALSTETLTRKVGIIMDYNVFFLLLISW